MSKVIKGGTIVAADQSYKADVLIEGGVIAAIGEDLKGDETLDATDSFIIPGGIDPHTHFEMPFMSTTTAETWETGTFAAASGGTTMTVDFVIPGEGGLLEAMSDWESRASRHASIDYGFHMCITDWSEDIYNDMQKIVQQGVNTFKHFMCYKGALMVNDDQMFASFQRCAALGALPLVHAENGDIIASLQQKYLSEGVTGPEAHAFSRPPEVEGEAVNRAIMIANAAGVPVYIVHVSCEQAHEAIRRARQNGMRVYGEPLIQHLTLADTEYFNEDWMHSARRVMSPPFRDASHRDSLWAGLAAGSLQVVASDHCSFTSEQKQLGLGDFTKIPNGTGGVEDRMSVLWTKGVEAGRLTPNEFVAVTSTNIAQILNIYPQKGAILPGSDADLVVWDPKLSKTISASSQKSIIDYNVFEGVKISGMPRYTLSRGEVIWRNGQNSTAQPGHGKFIKRPPFPAVNQAFSTWKEITAPRAVTRSAEHMPIGV